MSQQWVNRGRSSEIKVFSLETQRTPDPIVFAQSRKEVTTVCEVSLYDYLGKSVSKSL